MLFAFCISPLMVTDSVTPYERTASQHLRAYSQSVLGGGRTPHPDSQRRWLLSEIKTEQHLSLTYRIVHGHQLRADLHEHDAVWGGKISAVTRSLKRPSHRHRSTGRWRRRALVSDPQCAACMTGATPNGASLRVLRCSSTPNN